MSERIDIDAANRTAVDRMTATRPMLMGVEKAADLIPALRDRRLLHAGPPIAWAQMTGPLRGAILGAALFEGWASDEAAAATMAERGDIAFEPCHHHATVGPMAGVVSASMSVYVVEDSASGKRAFSTLNEGYGKVLRYGAFSAEVLDRLRWMNGTMAPLLAEAIREGGALDIRALIAEALQMGDEGHNRNKAGSLLFLKTLAPHLLSASGHLKPKAEVLEFLGGNALSVLNPIMAACKLMADAAHGVEGSTIVSTMARNGTEFGIRVSGLGDRWFTAPSSVPDGLYFPGFGPADANPDIGDSTITETVGIGAFAMAAAPAIVSFIGGAPEDATRATLEMYEITAGEHPHFTIPALGFRGTPVGIDLRRVVELGVSPRVNTGIAHRQAGVGQIGAGLVRPPLKVFEDALLAYAEKYGY
ncbi:MAG: DUF1116 domain-containing protein [Acidobacteriota bacterium]